jgi:hypothetical protein
MVKTITVTPNSRTIRRLVWISGLFVLLCFALPPQILADSPDAVGAEKCTECHAEETEAWQTSPHAGSVGDEAGTPAVACEDCHGAYVPDHPKAGIMQLTVDSSACKTCHTSTFAQWQDSIHARAGVQCIGCHLSHSQEFRLSDEELCASCHRDRLGTNHAQTGISCIECHLSSGADTHQIGAAGAAESVTGVPAASHDFTGVLSADCINCHGDEVHSEDSIARVSNTWAAGQPTPECEPTVLEKLRITEQTNRSLQTLAPISLGLGLGIGTLLGIIVMLVVGYMIQGRAQK